MKGIRKRTIASSICEKVRSDPGSKVNDSIGHIVAEVLGGSDDLNNLYNQNSEVK